MVLEDGINGLLLGILSLPYLGPCFLKKIFNLFAPRCCREFRKDMLMQIIVFSFTIHYSNAEDDLEIHAAGKYTHPLFHLTPLPPIAYSASFCLPLIPLHLIPTRNLKLIPQRRSSYLSLSPHPSQIMKLHHPYIYQKCANIS
jgi:hypothetical protein